MHDLCSVLVLEVACFGMLIDHLTCFGSTLVEKEKEKEKYEDEDEDEDEEQKDLLYHFILQVLIDPRYLRRSELLRLYTPPFCRATFLMASDLQSRYLILFISAQSRCSCMLLLKD